MGENTHFPLTPCASPYFLVAFFTPKLMAMIQRSVLPTAACLLILFFLLPACTKFQDHLPPGTPPCKISRIIFFGFGTSLDSFTITYNTNGDPDVAARANVDDGSPSLQFMYDSKHRLTGVNYFLQNDATENWVKYHYTNPLSQNPYIDSNFLFPNNIDTDPPTFYYILTSTSFQFDHQNRISQTTLLDITVIQHGGNFDGQPDTVISNYKYGPDGNLLGSTYDNKVNFLRTSRIFQFLQADYSLNNNTTLFHNIQYNEFGLPVQLETGDLLFLAADMQGTIRFKYDCACGIDQKAP